ncbi:putative GRAM domain, PH domain-containing protein [Lupinus albus]|uniref:Putative GRAM domain, PH domain-containing protein n=1 Tax=Lupinus albus TaxID=3870 RepID=A0A6A4PC47_LUPAL|nr:putative GRAM domain, PH domain-containing protein [Lupinus albus]
MNNPINNTKNQSPYSTTPSPLFQGAQSNQSIPNPNHGTENWGTHTMGMPAEPTSHPDNRKAALQSGVNEKQQQQQQQPQHQYQNPYVQHSSFEKPSNSPMESILHSVDFWSKKAGVMANNVWHNLRTSPSVSSAALGKVNLTVKAISEGGFESLYKQTFSTFPNEKLKKSFACYLSTSTGPVAGTLYLSNIHVAFCSDRPLCSTAPSGLETWSYYKVIVPLGKIGVVNPVIMKDNPSEKYIQIVTVDGHHFWLMGFVNFDKATNHLSEAISHFVVPGTALPSTSY